MADDPETKLAVHMTGATTLQSLANYPTAKQIFVQYNTTLSSSAPVEMLFSFGGLVLTQKRCRLTNAHFEKLVLFH